MTMQRISLPLDSDDPSPSPQAQQPVPVPPPELTADQVQDLEQRIVDVLKTCFDPEIPANIYDMGLIYGVEIEPSGAAHIRMTLTSPACPVAGSLPPEVQAKVQGVPGVASAKVDVVWEPPWSPDMMSETAKLELGM